MPFQSEKQRRYLWANEPEIARDWTDTYGSRIKKDDGGITQLVKSGPGRPGYKGAQEDYAEERTKTGAYAPDAKGAYVMSGDTPSYQGEPEYKRQVASTVAQTAANRRITKREEIKAKAKKLKKEARKKKFKKYKDKTSKFLQNQLKARLDQGYDFSMGLWGQRKRSHGYATDFLTKLEDEGKDISAFEDILNKDSKDWSAEDFNRVKALGGYEDYLAEYKGAPGMKESGDVGGLNKFVKTKDELGKPLTYGYSGAGGEGQGGGYMGYPSFAAWQDSQGQGGTTEVAEVVEEDVPSNFQPVSMAQLPYPNYPLLADGGRIGRAYGGIMDSSTGRRAYGFGSIGKIFGKVAKAAKKVLGSKAGKIGLTALALGMPWGAGAKFGTMGGKGWFGGQSAFGKIAPWLLKGGGKNDYYGVAGEAGASWNPWKIGIGALGALPFFMGGEEEDEGSKFDYEGAKNKYWDELMRIKAGAMAGTLDPTKFRYQGVKDGGRIGMYAGGQSTPSDYTMEDAMMTTTQDKLGGITDVMKQADLNRQGSVGQFYAAHGGSPSDTPLMDRVKELEDEGLDFASAMAQAIEELQSREDNAQGGRIGYAGGSGRPPVTMGQVPQAPQMPAQPPPRPHPMPAPQPNRMGGMPGGMNPMMNRPMMNPMMGGMHPMMNRPMMNPMGGRRMAQEGGLMDLGGMEKDYRNDGGFVPLGGEEKADDVPARLSKNEFVFTADAVRGAGDGDIDKGAEVMENIMKNLEEGGQISEETQGLSGAQEMFGVSERLGEVL